MRVRLPQPLGTSGNGGVTGIRGETLLSLLGLQPYGFGGRRRGRQALSRWAEGWEVAGQWQGMRHRGGQV